MKPAITAITAITYNVLQNTGVFQKVPDDVGVGGISQDQAEPWRFKIPPMALRCARPNRVGPPPAKAIPSCSIPPSDPVAGSFRRGTTLPPCRRS